MIVKIFDRVLTLQGPLLTWVYPLCTNIEHNERKDKMFSLKHKETFNIYIKYILVAMKEKTHQCVSID